MEFNETQVDELKKLFDQNDVDRDGKLNESELRKLLLDFEIDESFAPAMLRILIRKDADSGIFIRHLFRGFTAESPPGGCR